MFQNSFDAPTDFPVRVGIEPMDIIFRVPVRAYDYVYGNYGWFGVLFAGLGIVLFIVAIMIWLDRRR